MFQSLRQRQPGEPIHRILWWHFLHFLCFVWFAPAYRYRAWGVRRIPHVGPLLFVANHQSFFDPIAVGLGTHRRQCHAMARATLWDSKPLGWLISSLNAVPVRQGESDLAAMRQCVQVLQQGHALLIFPEGARTLSGRTEAFATGTMLLIKRAKPTVVPVGIEGAYAVYPRRAKRPRLRGHIGVEYGQPIEADELLAMTNADALTLLQNRVEALRLNVGERLRR